MLVAISETRLVLVANSEKRNHIKASLICMAIASRNVARELTNSNWDAEAAGKGQTRRMEVQVLMYMGRDATLHDQPRHDRCSMTMCRYESF